MFKKIRSSRDPGNTLFSEIRKEFRPYFDNAGRGLKNWAGHYPKFLFSMMVVNITLSVILVTTVFRRTGNRKAIVQARLIHPVNDDFDRILATGAAIRITVNLKKQVDSMTHQPMLSKADSAALLKDLDSLQHIRAKLNHWQDDKRP